jgi:hypothetical protein
MSYFKYLRGTMTSAFILGVNDMSTEGYFVTESGETLNWAFFQKGAPGK